MLRPGGLPPVQRDEATFVVSWWTAAVSETSHRTPNSYAAFGKEVRCDWHAGHSRCPVLVSLYLLKGGRLSTQLCACLSDFRGAESSLMKSLLSPLLCVLFMTAQAFAAEELRLGIIGLDTSHVTAFTRLLNDPTHKDHVPGA